MKQLRFFSTALVLAVIVYSCSKSNEEEVKTGFYGSTPPNCDTANMSYATDIKPILQANCYSCHSNSTFTISGTKLENYNDLIHHVEEGDVLGAITHAAGFPAMPENAPKLSDCDINKIKAWIERGALNN